jgi:hypothetical protein
MDALLHGDGCNAAGTAKYEQLADQLALHALTEEEVSTPLQR